MRPRAEIEGRATEGRAFKANATEGGAAKGGATGPHDRATRPGHATEPRDQAMTAPSGVSGPSGVGVLCVCGS